MFLSSLALDSPGVEAAEMGWWDGIDNSVTDLVIPGTPRTFPGSSLSDNLWKYGIHRLNTQTIMN